jgi:hypothetical protein
LEYLKIKKINFQPSGIKPNSVLARHYTDFSIDKLEGIYEKASLLSQLRWHALGKEKNRLNVPAARFYFFFFAAFFFATDIASGFHV